MSITQERFGVRKDGNVVIETTTYIESTEDHPNAVEIQGVEGFWVKVMVGNSLTALGATPVTYQGYLDAKEEHRLRIEAMQEELDQRREQRQQEIEAKKDKVRTELATLGLSPDTIQAILDKVQE